MIIKLLIHTIGWWNIFNEHPAVLITDVYFARYYCHHFLLHINLQCCYQSSPLIPSLITYITTFLIYFPSIGRLLGNPSWNLVAHLTSWANSGHPHLDSLPRLSLQTRCLLLYEVHLTALSLQSSFCTSVNNIPSSLAGTDSQLSVLSNYNCVLHHIFLYAKSEGH